MADVYIGTSGWHYKHWRGRFYPEDLASAEWLAYYAQRLHTVEVNNSFYRLLRAEVAATWYRNTPADFCFAIKASRLITHLKRLKDAGDALAIFFDSLKNFNDKTGPILFQLPPRWRCNLERLEGFLKILPKDYRYTFEFRDPSWHSPTVAALLVQHGAAFCIYQLAGFTTPLTVTANFVYLRLHGPTDAKYQGDYSEQELREWARHIRRWRRQAKDVYIYFDNDQAAYAAKNALELQALLK